MKQRYWVLLTSILLVTSLYGLFAAFDAAVGLEHARAKNRDMTGRCRLLAKLAEPGFKELSESAVRSLVGPEVIVDVEDGDLWVDDLVFRLADGRISGIDLAQSCPSLEPDPRGSKQE